MAKKDWTKWVIVSGASAALIVITWVWAAGRFVSDVEANTKRIDKTEVKVEALEKEFGTAITTLQTDVEWIKNGIGRIETAVSKK